MGELVFLNNNDISEEPFTTSKIIAEYGLPAGLFLLFLRF